MPRMIPLVHTGLQIPIDRDGPTVRDIKTLDLHTGQAYTAQVYRRGEYIGTAENVANGGGTFFHTAEARWRHWLEDFAAACRRDGDEAISVARLLDLLIVEREMSIAILARRSGENLARLVHTGGIVTATATLRHPAAAWREVVQTPEMTAEAERHDGVRWEIWTGSGWEPIPAAEQAKAARP